MTRSHSTFRRRGFTLIELLVVIAIIGLLAALLFPAFKRAQEGGYQASCAAHMQQIYQAAQLYRQDEKIFPVSLAVLLPADYEIVGGPNTGGTGFFKGGRDALICADDDTDSTVRSSYGALSIVPPATSADFGQYVWNYWGYRAADVPANCTATGTDTSGCAGTAYSTSTQAETAGNANANLLLNPAIPVYNASSNPIKYSLSNRFAPTSTIITHCVYHRVPTASGKLSGPYEITDAAKGNLARDVVLRLDGSARVLDVSKFHNANPALSKWATPTF